MSRGWFDDIYGDIMSEWKNFVIDNSTNDDEGDEVDEDELLEDFKNSDINISFTLDNLDAIDLLEIQKFLIEKKGVDDYLFNIMDIEKNVVEVILDDFEG